jgi:hypothetical protein
MFEQDWLKKNLVDAMRRLRCRPVAIRPFPSREAVTAAGNGNSRQFHAREGRAVTDVVRIVRRQTGVAHLLGHTQTPEDFHGTGRDMIAFRLGRFGRRARLDEHRIYAPPGQIDCQCKSYRPGADDQHIGHHGTAFPP